MCLIYQVVIALVACLPFPRANREKVGGLQKKGRVINAVDIRCVRHLTYVLVAQLST